jgi:hypothetical protein
MPRSPVITVLSWAAAVLSVAALAGPVHAQAALGGQDIPQITMHGVSTVRSLSAWPGFSLSVDRDAYVTVFAVTRGRRDLPIQVLSPTRPGESGRVKGGQRVRVRNLENREVLHLVNYGEAPVVVGFASSIKPDLSQFADGKRWGNDLLMDTLAVDQQDMVNILGKTIFGPDAQYDVVVSSTSDPMPLSRSADAWAFHDECMGISQRWTRRYGIDGLGFYQDGTDIDPLVRRAFGAGTYGQMPFGWALGVPLTLPNGGQFSIVAPIELGGRVCTGYRVAWWPSQPMPVSQMPVAIPPRDTTADTTTIDSPLDRLPRYPRPDRGMDIDPTFRPRGEPADRVPREPAWEASAWRRGETGSERRFPGVSAERGRPWSNTRTLPGQDNIWSAAGDRMAREQTRELDDARQRSGVAENGGANKQPAADRESEAPVGRSGGRSFPSGGSDTRGGESAPTVDRSGGAPPPPPPPPPAPKPTGDAPVIQPAPKPPV